MRAFLSLGGALLQLPLRRLGKKLHEEKNRERGDFAHPRTILVVFGNLSFPVCVFSRKTRRLASSVIRRLPKAVDGGLLTVDYLCFAGLRS